MRNLQRSFWIGCGLMLMLVLSSASLGSIVESFEALASDPVWQAPDNGWEFLTDSNGNGTVGALTGATVLGSGPSAPGLKYGSFAGTGNDNSAVTHANDEPSSGTFFFDAIFKDDAQVGAVGQNRFWLGPNRGAFPNDKRPNFYINKSATAGLARLQLNRGDNSYVDFNGFNLDQWYTYIVKYDFTAATWDLEIKDGVGATVFNEAGNYTIDLANNQLAAFATWEVRYGINGTGKSLAWNIDNVNNSNVPEPSSAALLSFGLGTLFLLRRGRCSWQRRTGRAKA